MVDSGSGLWPQRHDMALSFADAVTKLAAATGLDETALLHIGDTEAEVAANLTAITAEGTAAVALGPAREQIIEVFTQGWQQKLQAFDIRLRVGVKSIVKPESTLAGPLHPGHSKSTTTDFRDRQYPQMGNDHHSGSASAIGQETVRTKPPPGPAILSQAEKDDAALASLIREVVAKAPAIFAAVPMESKFFAEFGHRSHAELETLIRPVFLKRKDGGTLTPQGAAKCWRGFLSFLQYLDTQASEAEPIDKVDLCLYFKHRRDCASEHRRSSGTGIQAGKTAHSHLEWANRVFRLGLPLDDELVRSHAAGIGTARKVLAVSFCGSHVQ